VHKVEVQINAGFQILLISTAVMTPPSSRKFAFPSKVIGSSDAAAEGALGPVDI